MKKRINQLLKVSIVLALFFCSTYGFLPKNKSTDATNKSKEESFSKSDYFLTGSTPLVTYISENKSSSHKVSENIKQLCDYTKIPFSIVKENEINTPNYQFPSTLKTICISKTDGLNTKAIHKLITFIAKGGNLIITNAIADERFNFLIGLKKEKSKHKYNTTAKGIQFKNNFIPNLNNLSIHNNFTHFGLDRKSFDNSIEVILTAKNEENYPVVIKKNIGLGNVLYYNTSLEISKYERGVLFSSLLPTLEGIPYPVANINTIFLDDFPSPVYPFIKEPVLSEYNVSSQDFVKNIWWPDMLSMAKKYDIKYTTTIIFDYDENAEPPFSYKQWNLARENFIPISHLITKDVLKQNHELGFHGYNHVSLLKENWYEEDINIALNTIKNIWRVSDYGALPVSYIPPSNYIDKLGIHSLHQGLPSIKYMCSLYFGEFASGGNREFNPEPYVNTMFDFPRITSGFFLDDLKKYEKESIYLYTGIWTHFLHPDDIYQIPDENNLHAKGDFSYRNELQLNWKKTNKNNLPGMYNSFEKVIKEHKKNYPLATFPNVQKGGKLVANLRNSSFKHEQDSSFYQVTNTGAYHNDQNWFLYINENHAATLFNFLTNQKSQYTQIPFQNGYLVNIKTKKPQIKIPLSNTASTTISTSEILAAYSEFLNFKETPEDILSDKLSMLRKKIFGKNPFSIKIWKEYAKYCSWAKLEKKFWEDVEHFYYLKQNYEAALLAKEMADIIWYPSEKSKLIWLERQILTATDVTVKLELLKEYLKNYNNENNSKEIRNKLREISEIQPTPENKVAFIATYLWKDEPEKFAVLNILPVTKDYQAIAKELTWYFYENKHIDKALAWAELSKEIPIETQLYWLFEAGKYEELDEYYKNYNYTSFKDEFEAKKTMIDLYLAKNQFLKAWDLASSIPETHNEYESIRKKLNTFFIYQNRKTQKNILTEKPAFLFEKTKDSIQRIIMLEQNSSYTITSAVNTNRNDIATFDKAFTYSHISKKNQVHNFTLSNSLVNNIVNQNGEAINLYGINYEFISSKSFDQKLRYSGKVGFETDNNRYFYTLGVKGSYSQNNTLLSVSYEANPVKNTAAFQNYLYQNTLGVYFEKNFKNNFNTATYIESNYYTDHNADFTISLTANYPIFKYNTNTIRTSLESSYSIGSTNVNGIPYWMTKNRHYLGGGIQYQLNTDIDKTYILLDGMFFYDSYSEYFSRFRAKINFQLQKYFTIHLNGELFQQNLYYSNSLNVGLSYYIH
ncbi:DUF2194 domain-containing protein [Tenacibaculum sp. TC6]|uniref:DUF2194 domain-containing protein n=1 Tax=Tenacibaculum sp. TC6 TaxID=3423223 RepID=UPI003D361F27